MSDIAANGGLGEGGTWRSYGHHDAKAIARTVCWDDAMFGYRIGDPAADLSRDDRDNVAFAPLAAVIDPAFDWQGDRPPATPWHKTVIYEAHVKGFTALHTDDRHLVERGLTKLGAFFDVITGGEAFRLGDRSLALFLGVPG